MYKLTLNGLPAIFHDDGSFSVIPRDPENGDYVAFLAWEEAGNTAEVYVPPPTLPAMPPTPRQWIRRLTDDKRRDLASAIRGSDDLFMLYSDLMGASFVDVTDPDVIAAVGILRTAVPSLTDADQALLLAPPS